MQTPGPVPHDDSRAFRRMVAVVVVVIVVLVAAVTVRNALVPIEAGDVHPASQTAASPSADPLAYLDRSAPLAPALSLVDQDGRPYSLASERGHPVLVFFGYTHCPDVCPTTVGTVGRVLRDVGLGTTAAFASIDPERDTPTALRDWMEFLPAGFRALTGSPGEVREAADAWGIEYARIDTPEGADAYAMAHTASVFLVDADGRLRATFPYGTDADAMAEVLRHVAATPAAATPDATPGQPPSPTPTPGATSAAATPIASEAPEVELVADVRSTSVWAGGQSPVILAIAGPDGPLADEGLEVTAQVIDRTGTAVGGPITAVPVRPAGLDDVSYVATVDLPTPGTWQLDLRTTIDGRPASGVATITALDPGATPALGRPALAIATPTLDDVAGVAKAVTTDPAPDLRLSRRSTADALADGKPFVLVLDSNRFRVSPACGRAIVLARFLLDRWPGVDFIHHEPYPYTLVSHEPTLEASLDDPSLTAVAEAWGVGGDPWGAKSMPWIFVVDGDGMVRAKYQGVVGTEDVNVILSMLAQEDGG